MAPRDPARDLAVQVGAGPAALGVRPVAVGQQEDVAGVLGVGHERPKATCSWGRTEPSAMSIECRRVPSVCRRIVVLLVVALLGAGAPLTATAVAQSGGAGDQQYSDPFGNDDSSSGSGSSGSSNSGTSNSGSGNPGAQPLPQAPQTSGSGSSGSSPGSGTAGTAQSATSTSTTSPAATGTLPNTGLDARVLVLAGVVLVLVGVGLRLRNAPERF